MNCSNISELGNEAAIFAFLRFVFERCGGRFTMHETNDENNTKINTNPSIALTRRESTHNCSRFMS